MKLRLTPVLPALLSLGLASCGGGGGGGAAPAASTPAPTTPAPVAPVAPIAPPTNASLTNLTVTESFPNAAVGASFTNDSRGLNVNIVLAKAGTDAITVTYNAATQGYTINAAGITTDFLPANAVSAPTGVRHYTKVTGNVTDDLILGQAGLAFTYANIGAWSRDTEVGLDDNYVTRFFVYGVPTAAADLPRTGSATYQTAVGGAWYFGPQLRELNGSSTFVANFAAGSTTMTLNLLGREPQSNLVLGSFTGTGVINSSNASFSGGLASTNAAGSLGASYSGAYAGRFYGPAAAEVGAAFHLEGSTGVVNGFLIGKK